MIAFAFWLAFLACFPYYIGFLRWGLTGYALRLCLNIILVLECVDSEGVVRRDVVDVSSDDEFYKIAMNAIRAGRSVKGGTFE
ncbi:hypothetical protein ACM66I_15600 [Escherichia coli]